MPSRTSPGTASSTRTRSGSTSRPSPRTSPGAATHLPGLFYLIALNVIAAHGPGRVEGLAEVLVYNLIWFALPIGALAVCIVRPASARTIVGAVERWTKEHSRLIITVVAAVVGAALVVRGVLTL